MSSDNAELPVLKPARPSRKRLFLVGFLVLMLLIPLVRLLWIASHTETGWEIISRQWRDTTVGLVAGKHVPLPERDPAEQAAFWLAETQRIIAAEPDNAELAMGAALLLDSPSMEFVHRGRIPGGASPQQIDQEAATRSMSEFENRCRKQCLVLAAKATELQPNETRWWRMKAILLFADNRYSDKTRAARVPDWLRSLQQCREHDPDNALYDYIAASTYWQEGIDTVSMDMPVVSQPKFDLGMESFRRGQQRRFCTTGGGGGKLALELLRRTSTPRIEYNGIADGHSMSFRMYDLTRRMWPVLYHYAQRLETKGDLAGSLEIRRQSLHVFDQLAESEKDAAIEFALNFFFTSAAADLQQFVTRHPELVSAEEATRIAKIADGGAEQRNIYVKAAQRMWAKRAAANKPLFFASTVAVGIAASSIPFLLLAGVAACVVARRLRKTDEPDPARLGLVRHLIVWLFAFAATFVVFGLAPASIISPKGMSWVAAIAIDLCYLTAAFWLFWNIVVRRKFQFTLRTLLILTLVWAFFLGILKLCGILPRDIYGFQINEVTVPVREAGVQSIQGSAISDFGRWNWAFYQWALYSGLWMSVAAALAILALWHFLRSRRAHLVTPIPWRNRWASRIACLGRSLLAVAMLWIIAYLWFMPTVVQVAEREYQTRMAYLEKPQEYADVLNKTMAEVRAEQLQRKQGSPSTHHSNFGILR